MRDNMSSVTNLIHAGFSRSDATALRRISMTLHRWYELECGNSDNFGSWTISRGRKVNGVFEYDDAGKPFFEYHAYSGNKPRYSLIADRERGAQTRLAGIMSRYPGWQAFMQTDPRGCALYILRPGDVPEGADASSCYNRGIAVYKE